MQQLEELANHIIMILEANTEVMKSLKDYYVNLVTLEGFSEPDQCGTPAKYFENQLENIVKDCKLQITRARLLVKSTANRKALVILPLHCTKRQI